MHRFTTMGLLWPSLTFLLALPAAAQGAGQALWEIPLSPDLHWSAANTERLSCLGRHLAAHPDHAVIIEGHLDRQGTREYALGISDRPAMEAVAKVIEAGAASRQAHAIGLGFERAECPTLACMKRNRRLVVRANEGSVLPNCPLNDRDAELGLAPWPFPYASSLTVCVQALQQGRQGVCSRNQWAELAQQHAGNERPRAFDDYLEALAQEEATDGDVEIRTLTSWPAPSQQAWAAVTAALLPRDAAIARLKEAAKAPERSPLWTSSLTALIRIDSENRKGWALKIFGACLLPDGDESRCAHWPTEWIHGALPAREILELGSTLAPSEPMFTLTLAGLMRDTDHQRFTQAVFGCGEHCFPDLAYAPASIRSLARRGRMSREHSDLRSPSAEAPASPTGPVEMSPQATSEARGCQRRSKSDPLCVVVAD